MRKLIFIVILILTITSCETNGYKSLSAEVKMKLIRFGEGETSILDGDFLELNYHVQSISGLKKSSFENSVFLSDYEADVFGSEFINQALQSKTSGDSIEFICTYANVKNKILDEFSRNKIQLPDTSLVKLTAGVGLCMNAESYLEYRAEQVRVGLLKEMEVIEAYIKEHNLEEKLSRKGDLFYVKLKDYGAAKAQAGDDLSIFYECSYLDGSVFDKVTADNPLYINLGTPDQIVVGMESILKEIGPRESAMVIIPSYLAFGENGSSDGRVPAKTPIVIEVSIKEKLN